MVDEGLLGELGGHELIEEIARGGMGVVYRARQIEPERVVALKAILGGWLSSPEARERFRNEARAMASLEHPAILPVYQFGEEDGVPFFTMKLADEGTLAERIGGFANEWRSIAELIITVSGAVQFAHERGILHRDLKPGNILFDHEGKAYVSDFGMAKLLDDDSDITRSAALLGTPHYLAPEVAARSSVATTASDVWSLGVVLYELLAQAKPFDAPSIPALLREVTEKAPVPLANAVPADLRVITLKALSREPAHRYGTVRALAEDLQRWLEGQPIHARPVPAVERFALWVQRNPSIAALSGLLVLGLIIATGLLWQAYQRTNEALRTSLITQAKFERSSGKMGQRHGALETLQRAAAIRMGTDIASECAAAFACVDVRERSSWALEYVNGDQMPEFTPDLTQCVVAGRSGFSLRSAVDGRVVRRFTTAQRAETFAFSPDGKTLTARLTDNTIQLWLTDGTVPVAEIPSAVAYGMAAGMAASFSMAQQAWAIAAKEGAVMMVRPSGETRGWLPAAGRIVGGLRFDPKGERLAITCRDGIEVWEMSEVPRLLWSIKQEATLPAVAWHPGGSYLAMTAQTGVRELQVLDAVDGTVRSRLRGPQQSITRIAFHPHSYVIAATSNDSMLRLWDYRDARLLLTVPASDRCLTWSSDGRSLGCGYGLEKLAVFDFTNDLVLREFSGNNSFQQGVGHDINKSADGLWLLSTLRYQVQFWNALTRTPTSYVTSPTLIYSQAFLTPDSRTLIYSELIKGGHIMRLPLDLNLTGLVPSKDHAQQLPGSENAIVIGMTERGDWIVYHNDTYRIDLWPEGDAARATVLLGAGSRDVVFSPDLRWAVAPSTRIGGVIVFDLANRPWQKKFLLPIGGAIRWSPDGRWVYVSGSEERLLLNATTWQEQARWPSGGIAYGASCSAFSPDSKRLVISVRNESLDVLSVPDLRLIISLTPPLPLDFRRVVWSNDGSKLRALGVAGRMFEWDLASLQGEMKELGMEWQQ
jgi:eukaryotic-like serine/threonine-protein kinase